MNVDDLMYLMIVLDGRHLQTTNKKEMEDIISLKSRIRQMIYDIEDGKDGD